jgi:hypothetical protein
MRDLRADWIKWTRTEKLSALSFLFGLTALLPILALAKFA